MSRKSQKISHEYIVRKRNQLHIHVTVYFSVKESISRVNTYVQISREMRGNSCGTV